MAQEALARVGRGPPELPPVWGLPPPPPLPFPGAYSVGL